jgi:peptidoglycan hydrolase CwlO-like protein
MHTERQKHLSARVAIAVTASLAMALLGSAQSIRPAGADTARRLHETETKLAALEDQIAAAQAEQATLQRTLSSLLVKIDATKRQIEAAGAEIAALRAIERAVQRAADADQALLDHRAADAYMDPLGSIDVILGATSFQDLQSRLVYVGAVAQSDQTLIDALTAKVAELDADRLKETSLRAWLQSSARSLAAQASALSAGLARQRDLVSALDGHVRDAKALVKQLQDNRAREIALARLQRERARQPKPPPSPPPSSGSIHSMISHQFAPLGETTVSQALCVADRESGDNPNAVNPSSGAAGVFQFLPSVWPALSSSAGYGGRSAFDARANIGTAEWDVANFGWADWRSDSAACGL